MKMEKALAVVLVTTILVTLSIQTVSAPVASINLKPYRVLVVIDLDLQCDPESYVDSSVCTFHDIASLLKLWSVPFDVLRLDQNILSINQFIDANGKTKYGVIVWNCRQDRFSQDWSVLNKAVLDYGISLIVLGNNILEPNIRSLLGINYIDLSDAGCWYRITDPFKINSNHFVTRGYKGVSIPSGDYGVEGSVGGYGCHIRFDTTKTTVLAYMGQWPQLAVRDITQDTKAVWIGGNRDAEFHLSPIMAEIFRNSLTYCIGYLVYKTYPNTVMLRMDDPGSPQKAYLTFWLFPTLTKQQYETSLIQSLKKHKAVLDLMYVPGYTRNIEQTILKSWTLDWVDPYGQRQNLTSEYVGILEGLNMGVFEVESHGWTHMCPDLDSPPGPWWTDSSWWSNSSWNREFYDAWRGREVDAETQTLHLNMSIQWIQEAFNTSPLAFAASAHWISGYPSPYYVPDTYTYKIAGELGFGLASNDGGYSYLGKDMVFSDMRMTRTYYLTQPREIRERLKLGWDLPVMVYFHDKDVYDNPTILDGSLTKLEASGNSTQAPVRTYLSNDAFIGYMHSQVSTNGLTFTFQYDPHYCKYFANHASSWTVQFSDSLLSQLRSLGRINITLDGRVSTVNAWSYFKQDMTLTIPQGTGTHILQWKS
jgi:hypothetical protein